MALLQPPARAGAALSGWPTAVSKPASSTPSLPPSIRRLPTAAVIMRAFATQPERRAEQIQAAREKMDKEVAAGRRAERRPSSRRFRPAASCSAPHYDWRPTDDQIAEARKMLRPLNEYSFVEQMQDTRQPIVFTYLRRPNYYAAFASAPKAISEQQRLGLTFVWSPVTGVLLQSQTTVQKHRGELKSAAPLPFEASGIDAHLGDDNSTSHLSARRRRAKTSHFRRRPHAGHGRARWRDRRAHACLRPRTVFSPAEYSMRPAPVQITGPRPAAARTRCPLRGGRWPGSRQDFIPWSN